MTYRQRQLRHGHGRGRGGRQVALAFGVVATLIAIALLSVAGWVIAVAASAPDLSELRPEDKGESSQIFAADGSSLGYVQSDEIRTPVPWKDMPRHVRQAVVAIEDERFYEHEGIDYSAVVRAGVKNIESRKNVQGGSTITQQLVRALYIDDPERNFERKIREAKLASELEEKHSKKWILENYLNDVPFGTVDGRTAIGIEGAAETFFDKHARELTLGEAALLAGLPQAPSQYNPFGSPDEALKRRNEVLDQMAENEFITPAEAADAAAKPLGVRKGYRYTRRREPYFFDYVQEKLIEEYGVGVYRRGGLKVYTTIDPATQDQAREAINAYYGDPAGPGSAIAAVDPTNGEIKAMASSGTYAERTFNIAAQGHRQPGSAFKTMVLTAAIRQGVDPDSTYYTSKPVSLDIPGSIEPWDVKTFGDSYRGSMSLRSATLASDNTVFAQLILDVGPEKVCETARLLGITTKLDCNPAEGLGGLRLGVTPLEMASAYATLASGGIRREPTGIAKVVFPDGKSDKPTGDKGKRVLTDGEAYEVTQILEANVQGGTGTAASYGCPAAGKTGTTDEGKDAWFVGYTPKLSTSVWVGYPDAGIAMPGAQGGTLAAPVWKAFMAPAQESDCSDFPEPETAFESSPFEGEYSSGGSSSAYSGDGDTYYPPDDDTYYPPADDDTSSPPAETDDPDVYEAPPQETPTPAPEPAPVPLNPPAGGGETAPGQ